MDITATYEKGRSHAPALSTTEQVIILLRWTYGLIPIVAGADKFMHLLTDWNQYLSPAIANLLPLSVNSFMNIVGIIEIVAGLLVIFRPRVGSLVVALWLIGIAVNLVLTGQYYDVAVRDVVMAIGAFRAALI